MPQLDDAKLASILEAKIQNSLGYLGGLLSTEREYAMQYYRGDLFGNEMDGRSQVVSRDVAEAVDGMLPILLRIFTAGEQVVAFQPTRPDEEAAAAQATDYLNWIWNSQNPGFETFFTWFKDALLQKVGVIKIWWDDTRQVRFDVYRGLSDSEVELLLSEPANEPVAHRSYPDPNIADGAPETGAQLHDVKVKVLNGGGRIMIRPVPPEEFLIDRRAVSLEEAPFVGHRVKRTVSDLVAAGYNRALVDKIPSDEEADFLPELLDRFQDDDEMPWRGTSTLDPAMREVWLTECYLKVDYDGDGIAELRKITVAGQTGLIILDNEEVDSLPFATLTPIPMPHKFYGMSIADQTMDLQLIKSTLLRQMLDNLYLANNPEKEVVEGQVNLDDLLTSRPGGLKRVKTAGSINVLQTPFVASASFPMLDYIDTVREQRTGVSRYNQGLDPNSLNKTATGINWIANQSMQRIELIARVFAETGVRQAFRRIYELVSKYDQRRRILRLRGAWVAVDPSEWSSEMDLSVMVGLGTGSREQQIQAVSALINIDQQILALQGGAQGPLLTMGNLYNQLAKLVEASGLKNVDRYYSDPSKEAPPPDVAVTMQATPVAAAAPQAATINPLVAELNITGEKAAADIALKRAKTAADIALARDKAAAEINLARDKAGIVDQRPRTNRMVGKQQVER